MLIDFDIFRWILGDDAATVHASSCLVDPASRRRATSTRPR
jgi:hypothetical protein